MSNVAYSINESTVTCMLNGQVHTIQRDHPQVGTILKALHEQLSAEAVLAMFDRLHAVEHYMDGEVEIKGNAVFYVGMEVHNAVADRILEFMRDDLPYKPLVEFLKNLMRNPSHQSVTELYTFLEHEGLPITTDGHFIAYKGVERNYYSSTGNKRTRVLKGTVDTAGHIYNGIGEEIIVDRKDVDDDRDRTCSQGLHAGSHAFASSWGPKTVLVEINPRDVVSVPSDANGQKVRICHYQVIAECEGVLAETLACAEAPYQDPQVVADHYKQGFEDGRQSAISEVGAALIVVSEAD